MKHRFTALSAAAFAIVTACSSPESLAPPASAERDPGTAVFSAAEEATEVVTSAHSNRTEPEHTDNGRFNITLKFVVPVSASQRAVFQEAADRWERIIIADVPSVSGTLPSAFKGFPPVSTTVVDDIVIEVALAPIDGPGKVLGQAGPRYIRFVDGLPVSGVMFFDSADIAFMEAAGLFGSVIVHEMGHVLGIGTLWNLGAPFPPRMLRAGAPSEYHFTGKYANIHWQAEGGVGFLPIANVGGPGSIGGHWRESAMRNELMTPLIGVGENPLSRITASSLRDLGYGVAVVGERYALARGTVGQATTFDGASTDLDIAEGEQLLQPVGVVLPQP